MPKPIFRLVPYRMLPYVDWPLIAITLALLLAGIATLWGATAAGTGTGLWPIPVYARRQMIFASAGLVAMLALIFFDYRRLEPFVWILYGILIVSLVGLLVKGGTIKGAAEWYELGFFNLQPSEPGKIVLTLTLAAWISRRMRTFRGIRHAIVPLAIVGVPALLIVKQNDLGTALVMLPIAATLLWIGGLRKWIFGLFILLAVGGALLAYPHLKPHQLGRINTFLHPEDDIRGKGWNIFQAKTALGSGELTGKGWGKGTQTQFRFLPEYHTDFIFPTLGEQFGMAGCCVVLGLFALLIWRMLWLAARCNDLFGLLTIAGLSAMLATHILQNIGMVIGLLPITGLPLPFFSYGGSFMITALASIGLVLSIAARRGL